MESTQSPSGLVGECKIQVIEPDSNNSSMSSTSVSGSTVVAAVITSTASYTAPKADTAPVYPISSGDVPSVDPQGLSL